MPKFDPQVNSESCVESTHPNEISNDHDKSLADIAEFMRSRGFQPPESLILNGKFQRFGDNKNEDNCWYVGWQNARVKDGHYYYVVLFASWRSEDRHIYKPTKLNRAEKTLVEGQIKAAQETVRAETEKLHLETSGQAATRFLSASKTGSTPYMQRKLMPELYGCCIYLDRLQIPARDVEGKIWSIQSVFPDGQKRFMSGGKVKGCFYVIGDALDDVKAANLVEGIATASTVYQATGKTTTVVCFSAHNLVEVAKVLKAKYPETKFSIFGDDDRNVKGNTGRTSAEKAQLLLGGPLFFPKFRAEDCESTDFNDLHCKYGLDEVKNQLKEAPIERAMGFRPLGYDEGTYFFFDEQTKDVVKINTCTPQALYQIAGREFWEARYPGDKARVDWDTATHDLIRSSRAIGQFDSSRIRGTGVWLDEGRVVVNTGDRLHVDGIETALTGIDSTHIYVQTKNRINAINERPLTAVEGKQLTNACLSFKFKNLGDSFLLAGWILVSRIAGALPVRPHIWITGGMGTGKSTILEGLVTRVLGSDKSHLYLQGASTEAGIRQSIKSSSIPIIFDEFESHDKETGARIDSIIELLRNSWSATSGKILKGSAGGVAVAYQLAFCACVASIRVGLKNDADKSRFSTLELEPHGDDPEQKKALADALKPLNPEFGERLFARACSKIRELIASFDVISQLLAAEVSQRYGQQTGMLLAGFWILENDEAITEAEAEILVDEFIRDVKEEVNAQETDHMSCLLHLVTSKVTLRKDRGERDQYSAEISIGDAIKSDFWRDELRLYGIRVDKEFFYVACNHAELKRIYRGTTWFSDWAGSLKRNIPGGKLTEKNSWGSRASQCRSAKVPINLLP